MTIDSAWFIGVGAFVFVAWLIWTVARTRRRAGRAEPAPVAPSTVVGPPSEVATRAVTVAPAGAAAPVAAPPFVERRIGWPPPGAAPSSSPAASFAPSSSAPSPESPTLLPPLPPSPSSSRRLTAAHGEAMAPSSPTPAAAEAASPPEAPSSRFDAPSVERVLWLAPAVAGEWAAARPLRLPAGSLAVVGAALARAAAAAPPSATWAVCFAEGAAWAMARGDVAFMTTLAAANKDAVSGAPRASTRDRAWLDAGAASELAAVVLAALARERHLDALVDEARMLRAEISALPHGALAEAAAPLLTVAQDFARLARDAHGGFATMIRKAALRERVAESAAQSAVLWQAGAAALDAVRQQLVALTRAARFGEAQLDQALRRGGEWRDSRRLQDLGARLLAASHLLVLATGELGAIHGERLQSAAASLRAGQVQDRELGRRLRACERAVQGDPQQRRGELESRRLQLCQLLDGFDTDADGLGARRIVAVARQIEAEQASPALTVSDLLLRLGDGGTLDEVRLP